MNDLSEKEQLDEMRAWWAEYGRYVITGLVLGGGLIIGWNQWQSNLRETREQASVLYEQIMESVPDGDVDTAEAAMTTLAADYGRTVYPNQARLAMARLYMDKGRDQDAARALREILESDDDSIVRMVARLRLGKILLYQNKPDEAVALLQGHEDGGFAARYSEVLGDAYVAQGMWAEAEAAYTAALGQDQNAQTVDPELLQLKLNDLPDPTEMAATRSAIEAATAQDAGSGPAEAPATEMPAGEAMQDEAEAPAGGSTDDEAGPSAGEAMDDEADPAADPEAGE